MKQSDTKKEITSMPESSVKMDKNIIILECLYHLNTVRLSIIKDSTYYSIDYPCILESLSAISKLSTESHLIIDSEHIDYNQILGYLNKYKLHFNISRPTNNQIREMRINNLTLIGLYTYKRKLIKIR